MTKMTITIGATALDALQRYETAVRDLNALPVPSIMATSDEWTSMSLRATTLRRERDQAAELLASMVAVAMRMALDSEAA